MSDQKREKKVSWGTWGVIALTLFLVACSDEPERVIPSEKGEYAVFTSAHTLELYRVMEDKTVYTDIGTKNNGRYTFELCGGAAAGPSGRQTIGVVFERGGLPGCPLRLSADYKKLGDR